MTTTNKITFKQAAAAYHEVHQATNHNGYYYEERMLSWQLSEADREMQMSIVQCREIIHRLCRMHGVEPLRVEILPRDDEWQPGLAYYTPSEGAIRLAPRARTMAVLLHEFMHYFLHTKQREEFETSPHHSVYFLECLEVLYGLLYDIKAKDREGEMEREEALMIIEEGDRRWFSAFETMRRAYFAEAGA